jgi:uncharacterized protein (TIGR00255 family)
MKSMTGFGYSEYQDQLTAFALTLKSYNNRYLDINLNIPQALCPLEPRFREFLSSNIRRGRVELILSVKEIEESLSINLNRDIIHPYMKALRELVREADLRDTINLSHLLRLDGVLRSHKEYDLDGYWAKIEPVLVKTFREFEKTRTVEGGRTKKSIGELVELIKEKIGVIEQFIPQIETKIRNMLRKKFHEILGNEIDETRMLAETALFLIKYDIKEEVVRMKSHTKNLVAALREKAQVGKKLDFICQELNREINTVGSKSFFLEVNNAVITIKDAVETVREQIRNVE